MYLWQLVCVYSWWCCTAESEIINEQPVFRVLVLIDRHYFAIILSWKYWYLISGTLIMIASHNRSHPPQGSNSWVAVYAIMFKLVYRVVSHKNILFFCCQCIHGNASRCTAKSKNMNTTGLNQKSFREELMVCQKSWKFDINNKTAMETHCWTHIALSNKRLLLTDILVVFGPNFKF